MIQKNNKHQPDENIETQVDLKRELFSLIKSSILARTKANRMDSYDSQEILNAIFHQFPQLRSEQLLHNHLEWNINEVDWNSSDYVNYFYGNPENLDTVVKFITDNIWSIPFLTPNLINEAKKEDVIPSTIQILYSIIEKLLQQRNIESAKTLSKKILVNINLLVELGGHIWVNKLLEAISLQNHDLWVNIYGMKEEEYQYYLDYQKKIEGIYEFNSQIRKLAKGRINNYSRDENGELITTRTDHESEIWRIAGRNIPFIQPDDVLEKDISEIWRNYEQELINYITKINKSDPGWQLIITEINKLVEYLGDKDIRGLHLEYPFCLNTLRQNILSEFKRKIYYDTKTLPGKTPAPKDDRGKSTNFLAQNSSQNVFISYLALRRLMFPDEDLENIDVNSPRAHLDLDSVYEIANFEEYSESKQLESTLYRRNMILEILKELNLNTTQIFELGSGSGWLTKQLHDSLPEVPIHSLEISTDQINAAKRFLKDAIDKENITISQLSWDELSSWVPFINRNKTIPAVLLWMGRSATHEESQDSFIATLLNFSKFMENGDFLIMDMPDPNTGTYIKLRQNMVNAFNKIGENLDPIVHIELEDFDYLVDSPDGEHNYNRFTPSYQKLLKIFEFIGLEPQIVTLPENIGKSNFRNLEQTDKMDKCILERVNSTEYTKRSDHSNGLTDEDYNNRRNMVFVLKKTRNVDSFILNNKTALLQTPGRRL